MRRVMLRALRITDYGLRITHYGLRMDELLNRFLVYLQAGRNASPYTVKNYRTDIGQFLD